MDIRKVDIEEFERITNFPLVDFLSEYSFFIENQSQNIVDYYNGDSGTADGASFDALNRLIKDAQKAVESFSNNKNPLNNFRFWEILELVEEAKTRLNIIAETPKFLRASINKNDFSPNPVIDVATQQGQTLERLSRDVAAAEDPQNDWVDIALKNKVREEDYTPEGGTILKIELQAGESIQLQSVLDVMDESEKLYGFDLNRRLTFSDDDLEVLNGFNTFKQAAQIYSQLRKGQNPEFPEDGIDSRIVVGSNYSAFAYNIIFRDMSAVFSKDDTFKEFRITKIENDMDAFFLEFGVKSRAGEFVSEIARI